MPQTPVVSNVTSAVVSPAPLPTFAHNARPISRSELEEHVSLASCKTVNPVSAPTNAAPVTLPSLPHQGSAYCAISQDALNASPPITAPPAHRETRSKMEPSAPAVTSNSVPDAAPTISVHNVPII